MKLPKNVIDAIFILIVVFLLGGIVYSLKLYTDSQAKIKELSAKVASPQTAMAEEAKLTIENVGKHLVLPKEEPKVLSIANVEVLRKDQPFFNQANNGDKLLVFSQKVILYSPTLDKVIDIAQIRLPSDTPGPGTPSVAPIEPTSEPTSEVTRKPSPKTTPAR
jgi:hypothetical protein